MADSYVDQVAGELADLALADEQRSGDEKIVADIGDILGASSQTLQEAYLTAVRVRRAETRARELLAERAPADLAKGTRLITDESRAKAKRDETAKNEDQAQDDQMTMDDDDIDDKIEDDIAEDTDSDASEEANDAAPDVDEEELDSMKALDEALNGLMEPEIVPSRPKRGR